MRSTTFSKLPALAGALLLCGCTSSGPTWRVEPVYSADSASRESLGQGYATLARMYEAESRDAQALEAWRKAVAANPADADLYTATGIALVRQQRLGQAVEQFRRAAALQPDNARLLNNLGYALTLEGADDEAASVLGRAVMLDPAHALARANLEQVERRLALRLAPELLHGARPDAVATFQQQPAPLPPNDDVPDKVLAMLRGETPAGLAPLAVQAQPNLGPLARADMPVLGALDSAPALAELPPTSPAAVTIAARVNIVNGVGVNGAAARMRQLLQEDGLAVLRLQNQRPYRQAETVVQYRAGFQVAAMQVAQRIPAGAATQQVVAIDGNADLRVVLGHDRRTVLAACVSRNDCAPATEPSGSTSTATMAAAEVPSR
jgi:hypothetical protein